MMSKLSSFTGWTIVDDEGTRLGPSNWSVSSGALVQSSNIGSDGTGGLGTFALYSTGQGTETDRWTDYRVTMKIKSKDNDSIGVMFRYVDNNNYYRFSWDRQHKLSRLVKREDGVFNVLANDTAAYEIGQTYQLEIIAEGTTLQVWIDGSLIFSVTDASFSEGTIALYSFYNKGSVFDDVLVEGLFTGNVLLWDDFNDSNFTGWTIMDDEGTRLGPSKWSASSGALVQSSNIGSDGTGGLGTFALY